MKALCPKQCTLKVQTNQFAFDAKTKEIALIRRLRRFRPGLVRLAHRGKSWWKHHPEPVHGSSCAHVPYTRLLG